MNAKVNKKTVFGIAGVLLFLLIAFVLPAPSGLEQAALACGYSGKSALAVLGALVWAICWWAGMVIPDWCTALGLQCIWILAAGLKFSVVFSAFSKSTLWLIVGTFCLGAAITKTGLLTRISLQLMRLFPANFRGQVIAMMAVGTVCGPLMPSTTAKVVLGSKLAASSASLMDYENESKGRSGLFVAAWTGFDLTAPMFLSASFLAYSLVGSMPGEYAQISWMQWFLSMLPWGLLLLVGMYLVVMVFYRPQQQVSFSKEYILDKCAALGKVSSKEKMTAVIMGLCLVFWILEKTTGVSAGVVSLIGGICCFAFGILDRKEIATGVPWSFVLFVGVVLNMGDIFISTGISDWLLSLVTPLLANINSTALIILLVYIIAVSLRFLLASQTAVITLLTSLFAPIAISMGMHPLVTGLVVYSAIPCWIMLYQNPTYLAALEGMGGTIRHENTLKAAFLYIALALVLNLISIPYWGMLGYIG